MYWVQFAAKGRLAIMAKPRAGDWLSDEISAWRAAGIDSVVCLLEEAEIGELSLTAEAELCRNAGMEFISYPIADRSVPNDRASLRQLVTHLAKYIEDGKSVAIHCRAGIGRSVVIAACVMGLTGIELTTALKALSQARGVSVPDTDEQRRWIEAFYVEVGYGS